MRIMNNAKKMVLVPQEIAQQFSHSPHSTQQPTYQGLDLGCVHA